MRFDSVTVPNGSNKKLSTEVSLRTLNLTPEKVRLSAWRKCLAVSAQLRYSVPAAIIALPQKCEDFSHYLY